MKGHLGRTKVVLRHLPPTISQSFLVEHVDSRFSVRYHWLGLRPGKENQKHLTYSRASYIDFDNPYDVIEFAELFNGHVFVNEKGTQYKIIVEYAPSQRVPKQLSKNDGREGTIFKDPEYLEFLEYLAKPTENLPSAEIQLERKEAERYGAPKDIPIVTPIMDFVRQKRSANGGSRRTILNGKPTRRVSGLSSRNRVSGSLRRGLEKRASAVHVLRVGSKATSSKESTHIVVCKQDDQQLMDKSVKIAALSNTDALEGRSGGSGSSDIGRKKILLLKKEKEVSNILRGTCLFKPTPLPYWERFMPLHYKGVDSSEVSSTSSLLQNATTPTKNSHTLNPLKQNKQREGTRWTRSTHLDEDTCQNQPATRSQLEQRIQASIQARDRNSPRPLSAQSYQKNINGALEVKVHIEKQERRMRNNDRPDRGVWAPLRRSDGLHASDESLSSNTSQTTQVVDTTEGFYRKGGHRGSAYNIKDIDGSSVAERKFSKRGGSSGYGSHEKQVWIQKFSPGP